MSLPKFEFKSAISRNILSPERSKGNPFCFVFCRDTKEVFFTDAEGNYINFGSILAAVMNGTLPLALPASPVAGPQGPAGKDGAPGTQGPKGDSIVGPAGPKGDRGDVLIPNDSELAAEVIALRQQRARLQAVMLLALERSEKLPPSTRAHVKLFLQQVKQDAGI
jgi:hypothetical protein